MPDELRRLLAIVLRDITEQSAAMGAGRVTVDAWQQTLAQSLYVAHMAAMMEGRGQRELSAQAQALVNRLVGEQLDYLNGFADQLDQRGWEDKDAARAALYGGSIKASFWKGRTYGYDIPHVPGDGSTACLVNCRCSIEIDEQDSENLDADVYWRLGSGESCPTCVQRAQDWAPLRFRGGERV